MTGRTKFLIWLLVLLFTVGSAALGFGLVGAADLTQLRSFLFHFVFMGQCVLLVPLTAAVFCRTKAREKKAPEQPDAAAK